jgi:Eukaryotic aspartyl protease
MCIVSVFVTTGSKPPYSNNLQTYIVTLADDMIVSGQRFAEVSDALGLGLLYYLNKFDGILGLGFTSISVDHTVTVFENAMEQNVIDQPIFAFYLGDNSPGELTFGGYDPTKFTGDLITVPLLSATFWEIGLDAISAGSYHSTPNQDGSPITAIVDSGTSLLVGPRAQVKRLATAVGAKASFTGQYTIDCTKLDTIPDLVFTIQGMEFTLPGRSVILQMPKACVFAMMGMDFPKPGPQWILGDVFMREYYTVFHYLDQTISLAKAVKGKQTTSDAMTKAIE